MATSFYEDYSKEINESLEEVRDKLKDVHSRDLVKGVYKLVDVISAELDIKDKIQCGRQECSYCCHSAIYITPLEAEHIRAKGDYTIDDNLQKKQRTTDYSKLSFMDKACIMLKNGKCQVYENRPVLCRNHQILKGEDPLDCLKQSSLGNTFIKDVRSPVLEALNIYLIDRTMGNEVKNIADYDW
jgi:Fe-S-cluster containining protein